MVVNFLYQQMFSNGKRGFSSFLEFYVMNLKIQGIPIW